MISPKKAGLIIKKHSSLLDKETVYFLRANGRILAEDILSKTDMPYFARSSMDGFALRSVDVKKARCNSAVSLDLTGTVYAGGKLSKKLGKGQAVKIMTGALVPQGADCVLMKEEASLENGKLLVKRPVKIYENIRRKGEDIRKNELILNKGARINAGVISLLAALQKTKIQVTRQPRVAILVTGNELVGLKEKQVGGKVASANEYALYALVKQAGGRPFILGIARDTKASLTKKILKGFSFDILLISGGVSMGDADFVPEILSELNSEILFHKVAVKPGKPLLFAKRKKTLIFGLPGNPVSTMISFLKFVAPSIGRMSGGESIVKERLAILDQSILTEPERNKIFRVVLYEKNKKHYVRLAAHQGSGNIISMAKANCLLEIKEGVTQIKKGTKVCVQYLPD